MTKRLNYQATPPAPKDTYWVETLGAGQSLTFTVYSPSLWGVWTHYSKGGTKPCYEDHTNCEGGHNEKTMRWYGYLFGWSFRKSKNCFVQLTSGACDMLLSQVAPKATLRGLTLSIRRTAASEGRLLVEVQQHAHRDPKRLPMDQDPERSLLKMWKVNAYLLGFNKSMVSAPEEIPGESKVG